MVSQRQSDEGMNNYQKFLSRLTVSNIIDLWNEQHALGKTIPADWLGAIEEYLLTLEVLPEQRTQLDKLFAEEKERALKAISFRVTSSGNPNIGNEKRSVFSNNTYLGQLSRLAGNWLKSSNVIRYFTRWQGNDLYLKYREKEQLKAVAGDRDQLLLRHILEKDGQLIEMGANHASSHIGVNGQLKYRQYDKPIALKDFNKGKERIVFAICPSWGVIFPPYGLAKMVGTLRSQNYACKVYDLNIQTFHHLIKQTGVDYWRAEKQFYWQDPDFYNKYLAHQVNPILDMAVDAILNDKPTLVGLSVYSTNLLPSLYMVRQLRQRQPNIVIVIGGPATATETSVIEAHFKKYVNYFFKGEAEESFLDCLQNGSFKLENVPKGIFIGKFDSKIALNGKAFADYSDYDLSAYTHKDGGSIETSRGCVAQCSFCSETNFWKFRSMTPQRVVDEMKYQIKNYGFKRFWFVDSLANGDLKNFKQLVDLMIENKLEIGWNSYTRCDGRMTKEFIEKIAESGCTGLSYGVESGSQKVLHDMRKKIEVWEIYNNLRDTYNTNKIWTHVNWLIGFPTEENIDFYQSNILIYNVRKYVHHISPGMGCGISELTDLNSRPQTYGIPWKERPWETTFLKNWYTEGYKNTLLNRFIRIKLFHIWLEILKNQTGCVIENAQTHDDINDSFWFHTDNVNTEDVVEALDFIDFNRINSEGNISFFNANTANDFFAYFFGFYQIFRGFEMKVVFDPVQDLISWGNLASNYSAFVHFKVDNNGEYHCHIDHQFVHKGLTPETKSAYAQEKKQLSESMDFKSIFNLKGNLSDWKTTQSMTKETIHEMYRKINKKPLVVD